MKKKTTSEIIDKFKERHGDRYLYDEAHYTSSNQKVNVRCRTHGLFSVLPGHHAKGVGCRFCNFDSRRTSLQDFITRSTLKFGGLYKYDGIRSLQTFIVSIECTRHAVIFTQDWRSHVKGHTGCPECQISKLSGAASMRGSLKSSEELTAEFIQRARKIHGNRYDYSQTRYVNATTRVTITCPQHGHFSQVAFNHIDGSHCPRCTKESRFGNSFKVRCRKHGVSYHRALKRRQAGFPTERVLNPSMLRHCKETAPYTVSGVRYPNLQEAMRGLGTRASSTTVLRRLSRGICPEEAFLAPPANAGCGGVIYLITNNVTSKRYVGLTTQDIQDRWGHHVLQASRMVIRSTLSLQAAIREHGHSNFTIEVIDRGTVNVDLEQKERYWIRHHNCLAPLGYNLSPGGTSGGSKRKPTEVDGIVFPSLLDAARYLAQSRNITLHAAKWRIRVGRIDL